MEAVQQYGRMFRLIHGSVLQTSSMDWALLSNR